MSQLTTFSKILILIVVLVLGTMLVVTCNNCSQGCNRSNQQVYQQTTPPVQDYGDYQVVQQPGGQQVVVMRDDNGQEFFMNYLMWQTIFNSQGIGGCRGYYNQHRYDPDWNNQQSSYRSYTKSTVNNYYGSGHQVDDSKPLSEQIKYNQSKGFGKKPAETVPSNQSKGFTGKWFQSSQPSSTPSPSYKPSSGFGSSSNSSSSYKPSSGFGSGSSSSSYKPSSGFGKSNSSSSYRPSSGFSKPSSSGSSYKSSGGFGRKKN